jgi:hypothetical protein
LALVGAAALVACVWSASGSPRITLTNTGLSLEHPRPRVAWGLAGGVVLALLAAATPSRMLRVTLATGAALATAMAGQRLAYRLDAGPETLIARDLLGATAMSWREVDRVEIGPDQLVVRGQGDARIDVATAHLHPEVRTTLERIISRRVAESRASAR